MTIDEIDLPYDGWRLSPDNKSLQLLSVEENDLRAVISIPLYKLEEVKNYINACEKYLKRAHFINP